MHEWPEMAHLPKASGDGAIGGCKVSKRVAYAAAALALLAVVRPRPVVRVKLEPSLASEAAPSDKELHLVFRQETIAAWYETAMEHDKSLLTLSAAGIGLLAGFLSTKAVTSAGAFFVFIASMLFFLITIAAILTIFARNKAYLLNLLKRPFGSTEGNTDQLLSFLDRAAVLSFVAGVALSALLGGMIAWKHLEGEISMSSGKESGQPDRSSNRAVDDLLKESFNDAGRMQGGGQQNGGQGGAQQNSTNTQKDQKK